MNDMTQQQAASAETGTGKPVRKSKFVYTLLALLPTGMFGIAEFYIGRKILGCLICAATLLLPALDSGEDPSASSGKENARPEKQQVEKSAVQELVDFFPVMAAVLYLSSFVSGFAYIRNNCRE